MRKSTLLIVAGLAVALGVGELALTLLISKVPDASSWPTGEMALKSRQLYELGEKVDVVILGSSATGAGVDTEQLAKSTGVDLPYNAAVAVSTPTTNEVWLQEVVLEQTSPSLVLIGVPPLPLLEVSEEFNRSTRNAARGADEEGAGPALLRQRGVLADWDRLRIRERLLASGLWTDLGHITLYYHRHSEHLGPDWLPRPTGAPDYSETEDALMGMVRSVREVGAEPILVLEPFCCSTQVRVSMITDYVDWLKEKAHDWGVELWDMYSAGWPVSLYADSTHFNKAGTEMYTHTLAGLLGSRIANAP